MSPPHGGDAETGATEGFGQTAMTYKNLIDKGVPQAEAMDRAAATGQVYAAVSGVLEFAGLSSITKGTRFTRALEKVAEIPGLRRLVVGTLRAGAGEGTTEVLQGVASEALNAYATDDWSDFQQKYVSLKSDQAAKEFLSAFLLGGVVHGGIEATDPANYGSLAEWRKASGVEDASAQSDEDAPAPVANSVEERATDNQGDPGFNEVQTGQPLNQNDQPVEPGQDQSPENDLNRVVADREGRDEAAGQNADDNPSAVPVAEPFVRVQPETPIGESYMRRFTQANRVESVRAVEPASRGQRWAVSFFAERGVPVRLVESPDGSPLRVPAMWTGDGVEIDAKAGTDEYMRSLVYPRGVP